MHCSKEECYDDAAAERVSLVSGSGTMQVEAAMAMLEKLRLPEFAAPGAQPGRDLPAFQLGALANPQLQRHYEVRFA